MPCLDERHVGAEWTALRTMLAMVVTLSLSLQAALAGTIYVNLNAAGPTHDGTAWTSAYTSIQPAITASRPGDEVWVSAGTYVGSISLSSDVGVYGGFDGTETNRVQRNWRTNITVLAGDGRNKAPLVTSSGDGVVLSGFTVRRGGLGILVQSGTMTVANCIVSEDYTGVRVSAGTATLANSTISGNSFAGVRLDSGALNLINCTVTGSRGGVYLDDGKAAVSNCIVAHNEVGIYRGYYARVAFSHNDFYGNTRGNYRDTTDPTGKNGNINRDPQLSSVWHDIHLQPGSPCIDAGDDSVVLPDWADIDGQPRIIGAHVDIGSDESDGTTWSVPSRTWFVSPAGDDANDGASWSTAKRTVGAGLAAAQGSDEVWVAKGTYHESVEIPPSVSLYGGFAGTETLKMLRELRTNATVLNGQGKTVVAMPFLGAVMDGMSVVNGDRGVDVSNGAGTVTRCIVSGNATGFTVGGTLSIANCLISGNTVGVSAGSSATLTNCTITGNSEYGVRVTGTANARNCIVAFNGKGVGQYSLTDTSAQLINCDFYGNTTPNDLTSASLARNIARDPLFANAKEGNYRLRRGSPCIDAGFDAYAIPAPTDLDGTPRIVGPHVDMGCYEFAKLSAVPLGTAVVIH